MIDAPSKNCVSLYKSISDRLASQIDAKVFLPNEKLPSVRELMQTENISINTAIRVFQELEARGRVYVRSRSGYFVRPRSSSTASERSLAIPNELEVTAIVTSHETVKTCEKENGHGLALGSAVLDDSLIPLTLLNRTLLSIVRDTDCNHGIEILSPGLPELRCCISRLMTDRGVTCDPDDILITPGDGITMELALRSVTNPGDYVAIETPTYFGILQAIESAGLIAVEIPTNPEIGIDISQLEKFIKAKKVRCVLLNPTLQNPLGYTMPGQRRKELVDLLVREDIPLIEDDVFYDLYAGTETLRAIKSYDPNGIVIYCSSFSKVVAPGYRIGWCLPGRYRQKMLSNILERNISTNSLSQMILTRFIRKGYYSQQTSILRNVFSHHCSGVSTLIQQYFPVGSKVSHPAGGFVFWITLPDSIDGRLFFEAAINRGILITPGAIFYASKTDEVTFRVCIGRRWTAKIERAIVALGLISQELI